MQPITTIKKPQQLTLDQLKQLAMAHHKNNRLDEAVKCYQGYLAHKNEDAGIWTNLGVALRKQNHHQMAVNCYRRAANLSPQDAGIWSNLGNVLKDMDRIEEAVSAQNNAVELEPAKAQYRLNYGIALREVKLFEEAIEQFDRCIELGGDKHQLTWEKALCLLYLGHFREGWQAYEARWHTGDLPERTSAIRQWQGEDLQGQHILLYTEQGFGDTILAARYIEFVKGRGATVTLECKSQLHRLFKNLPVDHLIGADQVNKETNYDYQSPLMSLPGLFNTDLNTIPDLPMLNIPDAAKDKFSFIKKRFNNTLNIGIVWSGSLTFADNNKRSVGLERFLPFAEIDNVQLFSLQKGPREADLKKHQTQSCIVNLAPLLDDFADTAAAIDALDLIVMTDSSVAHLAASLNKPVLNILQYKPYWLYMPEEDSTPWYLSMQFIRQEKPGAWCEVFEKAKQFIEKQREITIE